MEITQKHIDKINCLLDYGLVRGLGEPTPGHMCVEAAICYALGLSHSDDPGCVIEPLRDLKIKLNDARWSSPHSRAEGLRRLAVAQLGSKDVLDEKEFITRVVLLVIRTNAPRAARIAAKNCSAFYPSVRDLLLADAKAWEESPTLHGFVNSLGVLAYVQVAPALWHRVTPEHQALMFAREAASAIPAGHFTDAAAHAAFVVQLISYMVRHNDGEGNHFLSDLVIAEFAEGVVQILIEMKAPGCAWL